MTQLRKWLAIGNGRCRCDLACGHDTLSERQRHRKASCNWLGAWTAPKAFMPRCRNDCRPQAGIGRQLHARGIVRLALSTAYRAAFRDV